MDQWSIFHRTERGRIGQIQKILYSWWKENIASPISKIDDFVKHVYREHNQEADHWAKIGAQGHWNVAFDRCDNSETWKAVKGFSDGSLNERQWKMWMWCVIKVFDRGRWVTISKIGEEWVGSKFAACMCRIVRRVWTHA